MAETTTEGMVCGRANPSGTGTMALVVELALIGVVLVDAGGVMRPRA